MASSASSSAELNGPIHQFLLSVDWRRDASLTLYALLDARNLAGAHDTVDAVSIPLATLLARNINTTTTTSSSSSNDAARLARWSEVFFTILLQYASYLIWRRDACSQKRRGSSNVDVRSPASRGSPTVAATDSFPTYFNDVHVRLSGCSCPADCLEEPLHRIVPQLGPAHSVWRQPAVLAAVDALAESLWFLQEHHHGGAYRSDNNSVGVRRCADTREEKEEVAEGCSCPLCYAGALDDVLAAEAMWRLLEYYFIYKIADGAYPALPPGAPFTINKIHWSEHSGKMNTHQQTRMRGSAAAPLQVMEDVSGTVNSRRQSHASSTQSRSVTTAAAAAAATAAAIAPTAMRARPDKMEEEQDDVNMGVFEDDDDDDDDGENQEEGEEVSAQDAGRGLLFTHAVALCRVAAFNASTAVMRVVAQSWLFSSGRPLIFATELYSEWGGEGFCRPAQRVYVPSRGFSLRQSSVFSEALTREGFLSLQCNLFLQDAAVLQKCQREARDKEEEVEDGDAPLLLQSQDDLTRSLVTLKCMFVPPGSEQSGSNTCVAGFSTLMAETPYPWLSACPTTALGYRDRGDSLANPKAAEALASAASVEEGGATVLSWLCALGYTRTLRMVLTSITTQSTENEARHAMAGALVSAVEGTIISKESKGLTHASTSATSTMAAIPHRSSVSPATLGPRRISFGSLQRSAPVASATALPAHNQHVGLEIAASAAAAAAAAGGGSDGDASRSNGEEDACLVSRVLHVSAARDAAGGAVMDAALDVYCHAFSRTLEQQQQQRQQQEVVVGHTSGTRSIDTQEVESEAERLLQLVLLAGASPHSLNPRQAARLLRAKDCAGALPTILDAQTTMSSTLPNHIPQASALEDMLEALYSLLSPQDVLDAPFSSVLAHLRGATTAAGAGNVLGLLGYRLWRERVRRSAMPPLTFPSSTTAEMWTALWAAQDRVMRPALASLEYDPFQPAARIALTRVLAAKLRAWVMYLSQESLGEASLQGNSTRDGARLPSSSVSSSSLRQHAKMSMTVTTHAAAQYHCAVLRMYLQLTTTAALECLQDSVMSGAVLSEAHERCSRAVRDATAATRWRSKENGNASNESVGDDIGAAECGGGGCSPFIEHSEALLRDLRDIISERQELEELLCSHIHHQQQPENERGTAMKKQRYTARGATALVVADNSDPARPLYALVNIPPPQPLTSSPSPRLHTDANWLFRLVSAFWLQLEAPQRVWVRLPSCVDAGKTLRLSGGLYGTVGQDMPLVAPVQRGDLVLFVFNAALQQFDAVEVVSPLSTTAAGEEWLRGDTGKATGSTEGGDSSRSSSSSHGEEKHNEDGGVGQTSATVLEVPCVLRSCCAAAHAPFPFTRSNAASAPPRTGPEEETESEGCVDYATLRCVTDALPPLGEFFCSTSGAHQGPHRHDEQQQPLCWLEVRAAQPSTTCHRATDASSCFEPQDVIAALISRQDLLSRWSAMVYAGRRQVWLRQLYTHSAAHSPSRQHLSTPPAVLSASVWRLHHQEKDRMDTQKRRRRSLLFAISEFPTATTRNGGGSSDSGAASCADHVDEWMVYVLSQQPPQQQQQKRDYLLRLKEGLGVANLVLELARDESQSSQCGVTDGTVKVVGVLPCWGW